MKLRIWFKLSIAISSLMLAVSQSIANQPPKSAALDAALQGAWCYSDDGGKTCWSFDIYTRGSSTSCGFLGAPSFAKWRYSVEGSIVCHVLTEAKEVSGLPNLVIGDNICLDILEVNDKFLRFRLYGASLTVFRFPQQSVDCDAAQLPRK